MKKYLITSMIGVSVILSACSNNDNKEADPVNNSKAAKDYVDQIEENHKNATDDPMIVGNKNSGENRYVEDISEPVEVIARYSSDTTDADGFTTMKFDSAADFTFKFALTYIKSDKGVKQLAIFGEAINNNAELVEFQPDFTFLTDTKENPKRHLRSLNTEFNPGFTETVTDFAYLENQDKEIPKEIKVIMNVPEIDGGDSYTGETVELNFTKDE